MQNLVFVLSSTNRTDQITAFIDAHNTVHIPVEKKDFLKMSSLGIFNRQRARGPHLWTCCLQSFIIQPGSPEEKVDSCPYLKSNEICFLVSLYSLIINLSFQNRKYVFLPWTDKTSGVLASFDSDILIWKDGKGMVAEENVIRDPCGK